MPVLTPAAIRDVAAKAGFTDDPGAPDLTIAVAVALAESGGRTDAINRANRNKTIDYGLFQINTVHRELLARHDWADPEQNARMAFAVFKAAKYRWTPWATYNSGSYKKHMVAAGQTANPGMRVTIRSGDTLSRLASVHLRDPKKWPLIWHAPQNAAVVGKRISPERIQPGDVFFIPGA